MFFISSFNFSGVQNFNISFQGQGQICVGGIQVRTFHVPRFTKWNVVSIMSGFVFMPIIHCSSSSTQSYGTQLHVYSVSLSHEQIFLHALMCICLFFLTTLTVFILEGFCFTGYLYIYQRGAQYKDFNFLQYFDSGITYMYVLQSYENQITVYT